MVLVRNAADRIDPEWMRLPTERLRGAGGLWHGHCGASR